MRSRVFKQQWLDLKRRERHRRTSLLLSSRTKPPPMPRHKMTETSKPVDEVMGLKVKGATSWPLRSISLRAVPRMGRTQGLVQQRACQARGTLGFIPHLIVAQVAACLACVPYSIWHPTAATMKQDGVNWRSASAVAALGILRGWLFFLLLLTF